VSVKSVVLPFNKFPQLVPVLGPEMQSTGESMGTGPDLATALAKAQGFPGTYPISPPFVRAHVSAPVAQESSAAAQPPVTAP
jgi:carbamoyl-phosphate synthase large subunit